MSAMHSPRSDFAVDVDPRLSSGVCADGRSVTCNSIILRYEFRMVPRIGVNRRRRQTFADSVVRARFG